MFLKLRSQLEFNLSFRAINYHLIANGLVNCQVFNVLLIEHSLDDSSQIAELLYCADTPRFRVERVPTVDKALKLISRSDFDAILLCIPIADSLESEAIDSVSTIGQRAPQSPVLVLNTKDDSRLAVQFLLQGAQDYLVTDKLQTNTLIRSIQYAIARQQTEFNHRQQALMKQMLDRIRNSIDLEEILKTTATVIQQYCQSDRVLIYRCETSQLAETTVVSRSLNAELDRLAIEQFISAVNFSSLRSILSKSAAVRGVEDTFAASSTGLQVIEPQLVRSYLILPVWVEESTYCDYEDLIQLNNNQTIISQNEGLWGMVVVYNIHKTRRWQDWEISFLQRLTTQVTVAIQHSQLCCRLQTANQKLQKLAILDGLTGIANRRYFDLVLKKEWQRLAREQQPLSLILCDIDYFKLYNDTYGHSSGDRCLQKVAQILMQSTRRPADLAARYGGEEFALILPNTDAPGALFIAHKISQQLGLKRIPHQQSKVSNIVTLSIGVATKIPDALQPDSTIIEIADNLLYKAKEAGRNQLAVDNWLIS